jgi:hypothetical protein
LGGNICNNVVSCNFINKESRSILFILQLHNIYIIIGGLKILYAAFILFRLRWLGGMSSVDFSLKKHIKKVS